MTSAMNPTMKTNGQLVASIASELCRRRHPSEYSVIPLPGRGVYSQGPICRCR